jgi:hypothetical protein
MIFFGIFVICTFLGCEPKTFPASLTGYEHTSGDKVILDVTDDQGRYMFVMKGDGSLKALEKKKFEPRFKESSDPELQAELELLFAAVKRKDLIPEPMDHHTEIRVFQKEDPDRMFFFISGPGRRKPGERFSALGAQKDKLLRTLQKIWDRQPEPEERMILHWMTRNGKDWIFKKINDSVYVSKQGVMSKLRRDAQWQKLIDSGLLPTEPVNAHTLIRTVGDMDYEITEPSGVTKKMTLEQILNHPIVGLAALLFIGPASKDLPEVQRAFHKLYTLLERMVLDYTFPDGKRLMIVRRGDELFKIIEGGLRVASDLLAWIVLIDQKLIPTQPMDAHTTVRCISANSFEVVEPNGERKTLTLAQLVNHPVVGAAAALFLGRALSHKPEIKKRLALMHAIEP